MASADKANELMQKLDALQMKLRLEWIDKSLPKDWNALDHWHPIEPKKERVTIRLDADMLRWFRKLGPGYGARINMVLRVYWTALLSGEIVSHFQGNEMPQFVMAAREMLKQSEEAHEARQAAREKSLSPNRREE